MSDIFKVRYIVEDTCSIEVEAESEEDARNKVLTGQFEENETYEFLDADIVEVTEVVKLG